MSLLGSACAVGVEPAMYELDSLWQIFLHQAHGAFRAKSRFHVFVTRRHTVPSSITTGGASSTSSLLDNQKSLPVIVLTQAPFTHEVRRSAAWRGNL